MYCSFLYKYKGTNLMAYAARLTVELFSGSMSVYLEATHIYVQFEPIMYSYMRLWIVMKEISI
jgi:hypothetical protein